MAGKKTGKRLLTWVLVLVMALSLLPLNALADELDMAGDPDTSRTQSTEENGAYLVKSATKNNDDTYKIQLESWLPARSSRRLGLPRWISYWCWISPAVWRKTASSVV